jgi:CRISPR-associated endonuclease/helicase Cas3
VIHLDGVSVPRRNRPYLGGLSPYDHQAESEALISSGEPFFAINESPTGSGKYLSWLKPVLDERIDTIAVYPTNALVQEQVVTAKRIIKEYYDEKIGRVVATGPNVAEWCHKGNVPVDKGRALAREVENSLQSHRTESTVLFTNPDTLTLVRKNMYRHRGMSNRFDHFQMVVFDEFHLADVKQRDSLLFLSDEMYYMDSARSNTDRFYFLSATPEGEDDPGRTVFERLRGDVLTDETDANVHRIAADARPMSAVSSKPDWSPVMPPVRLRLSEGQTFRTSERLLTDEAVERLVEFCENGRTVIMLDGVHEVDRVFTALSEKIDRRVERITGFNRGDVQKKLDTFDVLVILTDIDT